MGEHEGLRSASEVISPNTSSAPRFKLDLGAFCFSRVELGPQVASLSRLVMRTEEDSTQGHRTERGQPVGLAWI